MKVKDLIKTDVQLGNKALNLEYAFEWNIDIDAREFKITVDIEEGMFDYVDTALTALERLGRKGITIKINSGGGDVYEALAIIDRIRSSTCYITTEGYGKIMSAASAILASGNKRRMGARAQFMHHETSLIIEGTMTEAKNEMSQAVREEVAWCKIMEEFSQMSYTFWETNGVGGKNAYFNAERCLELGVIDEIFAK